MKNSNNSSEKNLSNTLDKPTQIRQKAREKINDSVKNSDSLSLEPLEPISFGLYLSKDSLRDFLKLQKRLQYGIKSKIIHKSLELANKFLDIQENARPFYSVPRELIE